VPRDVPPAIDLGRPVDIRAACAIAGRYVTNGGNIKELVLAPDGTYSADGSRFMGKYLWNGSLIEFVPSFGSASSECPSRFGSSYTLVFDPACTRIFVMVRTDNCTGAGLLSQSSMLTRL
jgi:hypothetical protein